MDRAGERALIASIRQLYGRDLGEKLPMDLRGRTDTSITRDLLEHIGVVATPEEARRLQLAYLSLLPSTMPAGKARVLAGIHDALEAVDAHPEIHQALLTGNLEAGAKLKLGFFDLWKYFEFGAFADDSHIRDELGPFALRRAKEKLGITFSARARLDHRRHAARRRLRQGDRCEDDRGRDGRVQRGGTFRVESDAHVCGFLRHAGAVGCGGELEVAPRFFPIFSAGFFKFGMRLPIAFAVEFQHCPMP